MAIITAPLPDIGAENWGLALNTILTQVNSNAAPLVSPTFTGTVTTPTINVTSALQISGTNIFSRNNTWTGTNSFVGITNTAGNIEASTTITGNTTLDGTYNLVLCNSASNFTINLPACATNTGRRYKIKNINTGIITIDANASELIDGQLTTIISNIYDCIELFCNGAQWFIL